MAVTLTLVRCTKDFVVDLGVRGRFDFGDDCDNCLHQVSRGLTDRVCESDCV